MCGATNLEKVELAGDAALLRTFVGLACVAELKSVTVASGQAIEPSSFAGRTRNRLTRTRSATGGARRGGCRQVCGSVAAAVTRGAC